MSGKSGKAAAEPTILALEARWGITLTDHEKMLLTSPKSLLGPIEGQERFLLGIALAPRQCPACLSSICERNAAKGGLDFRKSSGEHEYECPRCQARLVWNVYLVGDPDFTVHPDSARPVTS